MKLSEKQLELLRDADLLQMSHEAREDAMHLLNDQGFTVFAVALSNLIAEMVEHPEKIIREAIR